VVGGVIEIALQAKSRGNLKFFMDKRSPLGVKEADPWIGKPIMPRLLINPGSPTAWEIQLKPGANLLGRGFANDFKIDEPSVSGSHCEIALHQGRAVIKDLGSTNGTYVNRSPVQEAALQPGQTIHLGGVEMRMPQRNPPPSPKRNCSLPLSCRLPSPLA
jgi:pSer/pThr/pTyr-binding forkhead associated (FHA) protein